MDEFDDTPPSASTTTTRSGPTNYIVTAQEPTVINGAVSGNFRNEKVLDIIASHVNRLTYYTVEDVVEDKVKKTKLIKVRVIPVYGRIATLNVFRLPGETLDNIVVLTVKYHLTIISFDPNGLPKVRASGSVADRVGRPAETGIITCIHSTGLIALRLYDGFLKLIQWKDNEEWNMFSVRFEHHNVTDLDFLHEEIPTVVYFHEDQHGKHLKICSVDLDAKEMSKPFFSIENVETAATLLIPVPQPFGGVVVVGQESMTYLKGSSLRNYVDPVAPPDFQSEQFSCYVRRADGNILLGDMSGRILLLTLIQGEKNGVTEITKLDVTIVGHVSIPECLVALDNSFVFVGSRFGDSQLIQITGDSNTPLVVKDFITNIGPVRDFIIMDKDGQRQLVSCSGCFKDGTLRVIRNGVGIEVASMTEFKNIRDLFVLKLYDEDKTEEDTSLDNFMVISFSGITHLFRLDGKDPEDCYDLAGFELEDRTIYTGNLSRTHIVQVTPTQISVISTKGLVNRQTVKVPKTRFTMCSVNTYSGQLIAATASDLYYYKITTDGAIELLSEYACVNELACVDISPIEPSTKSTFFAACFWKQHNLTLFSMEPDIKPLADVDLDTNMLPRSVLIIKMESITYIMVALGDATIIYYTLDVHRGEFMEKRKVSLGSMPASLKKFQWDGTTNVFFCSDKPTIIYSNNQKLYFSNVNMKAVTSVEMVNSDYYSNRLIMSDGAHLIFGAIEHIQKLHVRSIRLYESVSRIAYQPETNTVAILTARYDTVKDGKRTPNGQAVSASAKVKTSCASSTSRQNSESQGLEILKYLGLKRVKDNIGIAEVHSVCILDTSSFQCAHSCELAPNEMALSICSTVWGDIPYYVVGTAFIHPDENEPKLGRIIVFQIQVNETDGPKLRIISEQEVKGAVYSIATLSNKLICAVNSSVRLFEWTAERELRLECSHFNSIAALYLKTKDDLVLVGDIMRSLCLLNYKAVDSTFLEVARDYAVEWISACEIIDSETFLGAENHYNIFCCQRNSQSDTEEGRTALKQIGEMYLGQMINVFRRGTIIANEPEPSMQHLAEANPIMFGTSDGGLGVIVQIPPCLFTFLSKLQAKINSDNIMRVTHNEFRNFCVERRVEKWSGFIDGDLIETVSSMPAETVREMIKDLCMPCLDATMLDPNNQPRNVKAELATVENVQKLIEELARIH